jgi:hypothetical protein
VVPTRLTVVFNSRREGFNTDNHGSPKIWAPFVYAGNVNGVTIANCRIDNTAVGITYAPAVDGSVLDNVRVQDSLFENIDEAAINLAPGTIWRDAPLGRIAT